MAYRVKVNGVQIFGNNESYPEWNEFIASQGIVINEEGGYEGETTDFMGMLQVVEQIVMRLNEEQKKRAKAAYDMVEDFPEEERTAALSAIGIKSIFDLSNIPEDISNQDKNDKFRLSLLDLLLEYVRHGYAFMPYALYLACEDKLEKDETFAVEGHFECFKVRDGETIRVSAG